MMAPSTLQQDTRTHVVGELYDTERSYVESLQILIEKYMKPLKSVESNKSLIDSNLVDEIFYTIPEILQHHEHFLGALQDKLSSDWDSSRVIGSVFIDAFTNQQIIDTYTAFINNWKNARHAIKVAIQSKQAFERFLEAMSREHKNKLTLDALLIMPVQRIPRYELLIKELIKHTPVDHPDYYPLIEAQKKIHELALKIDRTEREMIHQEQLKDLESLIEGHVELQHPQRDFIRYDLVTITGSSSLTVATKKERVLFLFCDLLIMTSVKKKVSRRSNLQTAFANSSNDISLLEGNKFKLLLRVSLDHVGLKIENEKLFQLQQDQIQEELLEQQQQTLIAHKKLINDQRRDIEADLYHLHQIKCFASKLVLVEQNYFIEHVNKSASRLRERLFQLDQSEVQAINTILGNATNQQQQQAHPVHLFQDSCVAQLPVTICIAQTDNQSKQQPLQSGTSRAPTNVAMAHLANELQSNLSESRQISSSASSVPSPQNSMTPSTPSTTPQIQSVAAGQLDTNTSLEFIISNSGVGSNSINGGSMISNSATNKELLSANLSLTSATSDSLSSEQIIDASQAIQNSQLTTNSESLVVTFASIERRQAFLQAFLAAKKQRQHQLRQQIQRQQQQNNKIFSSSITLRLSQPDGSSRKGAYDPTRKSKQLLHQDNIEIRPNESTSSSPIRTNKTGAQYQRDPTNIRISSAPFNKQTSCAATIVHQMSAPQSLTSASSLSTFSLNCKQAPHTGDCSNCIYCTSNLPNDLNGSCQHEQHLLQLNKQQQQHNHHHHHHHHQLIHQPASQPASLDTICCYDRHDGSAGSKLPGNSVTGRFDQFDEMGGVHQCQFDQQLSNQNHYRDYEHQYRTIISNSNESNDAETGDMITFLNEADRSGLNSMASNFRSPQLIANLDSSTTYRSLPRLVSMIPVDFLSTHHSALQLCCANPKWNLGGNFRVTKKQTIKDDCGLIWLFLSNGYVSHVALLSLKKQTSSMDDASKVQKGERSSINKNFNILPMVLSSGDICKSQINCAAQVCSFMRGKDSRVSSLDTTTIDYNKENSKGETVSLDPELTKEVIEPLVSIETATPPIEIKHPKADDEDSAGDLSGRLSESAPSFSITDILSQKQNGYGSNLCSASASKLEIPHHVSGRDASRQRHGTTDQSHHSGRNKVQRAVCRRHHHTSHEHLRDRAVSGFNGSASQQALQYNHRHGQTNNQHSLRHQSHHSHYHDRSGHHHHHHQHSHHHGHHLHHHHHHHHNHSVHHHSAYNSRHHTVPLAELRRVLERQSRIFEHHHLAIKQRPSDTNNTTIDIRSRESRGVLIKQANSLDSPDPPLEKAGKKIGSATPPAAYESRRRFGSARLLRHQASLKTSAILAKLVSGAHKGSFYLKKSHLSPNDRTQSDLDDNDTDTDSGNTKKKQDDVSSIDSMLLNKPGQNKCFLDASQPNANGPIISPLSSVSSLNSTNSSITVNSVCASSAGDGFSGPAPLWSSAVCCALPTETLHQPHAPDYDGNEADSESKGMRGRSATVPSRSSLAFEGDIHDWSKAECGYETSVGDRGVNYKVCELSNDNIDNSDTNSKEVKAESEDLETESSLWLGCDDGSLIIINCLNQNSHSADCNLCDPNQQSQSCGNKHFEIKLNAAICDIRTHEDKLVFVALSNGQLAIFSREPKDSSKDNFKFGWSLTNPKLLNITANELNSTSKLCLVDGDHIWYSYGRNIFVLNITTLKLETTIMAPTNDLSLQFTMQSIAIDNMELMRELSGVWISFKNSHLIQFYCLKTYKLLVEINLFEPINKILSFGNEIIRQHKTACLKATFLLSVSSEKQKFSELYIGTSAGVILHVDIRHELFSSRDPNDTSKIDLNPQVASLCNGHSGHVKFMHVIQIGDDSIRTDGCKDVSNKDSDCGKERESEHLAPDSRESFLISGGSGIDLYGPNDEQLVLPLSGNEDDNTNYLLLWKLYD